MQTTAGSQDAAVGSWVYNFRNRAQRARLQAADLHFLAVAEERHVGAAGKDADLGDDVDVGETASSQSNEFRRIEPLFEIFQAIGDRVPLVANRRDVQQLAVCHD